MRVLVIDDEPTLLAAARRVLGTSHEVTTASEGKVALDLLATREFDLVLSDLMLADMEGADVYTTAVEKRPDLEPRFLFMTGGALTPRSTAFKAWLGDRCLSKPFDAATLVEAVRRFGSRVVTHRLRASRPRIARVS
jgi:DNA-binding response OmpR family regulator